ncbi:uncharacterized protein MYCFIDRAFT_84640 [Pseudocercospora fijiensis CIRAD86]|uniref:Heterokaryon incompatibility domain-containing protein n=1 Tax=Pseudocercospora fijiensis (strain CIRAD86) TaxID=383855 RepID=M2YSB0_PSEFD|nr:uncharacterized protein MYCFIDRAFT_84640 [Pseudocercospora fijiensis CIRAD86]EME80615.1 hypothetical protein MYCFIDRAFT_84640 [Pseudocercospora fijiensis CIRAD86]
MAESSSWHDTLEIRPRPNQQPPTRDTALPEATITATAPLAAIYASNTLQNTSGSSDIRILLLAPSRNPHANLSGALTVISLPSSEQFAYEALSYTWDAPLHSHGQYLGVGTLWIEEIPVCITGNLSAALKRLRQRDRVRALWVDAVCMNLEDHFERATQVHRVPEIFGSAVRVIAWLGGDYESGGGGVGEAFVLARSVSREMMDWDGDGDDGEDGSGSLEDGDVRQLWECVMQRRFFQRRWVLGELACADKILFVCGAASISDQDLLAYIDGAHWSTLTDSFQSSDLVRFFDRLRGMKSQSILDILYTFQNFGCRDDRDRIAAFMGVFKGSMGKFRMSYDVECEELYFLFAGCLMEDRNCVPQLLQAAAFQAKERFETGDSRLQTWVPDWRMKVPKPAKNFWWGRGGERSGSMDFQTLNSGVLRAELPFYGYIHKGFSQTEMAYDENAILPIDGDCICGPMWSDFEIGEEVEEEDVEACYLVLRPADGGCYTIVGFCGVFLEGFVSVGENAVKEFWIA